MAEITDDNVCGIVLRNCDIDLTMEDRGQIADKIDRLLAERDQYREMWESNAVATAAAANRALTAEEALAAARPASAGVGASTEMARMQREIDHLNGIIKTLSHARAGSKPEGDGWQPIETRPASDQPCWIGHAPSSTMIVAYPAKRLPGNVWRIMWSDRILPWLPTHWRPLPTPPQSDATTAALSTSEKP